MKKLTDILIRIYFIMFTAGTGLTAAAGLFMTIRFEQGIENDRPVYLRQNTFLLLLCMGAVLAVLWLLRNRTTLLRRKGFLWGMMGLAGFFCLFFTWIVKGQPTNDAAALNGIINAFAEGDFRDLTENGYLCIYPFQIGYVFCGQILAGIFGRDCFPVYWALNILSILITLGLLWRMTEELSEEREAVGIAAFLSGGMFCLFLYASFIYGDIWSLAPQTAALYYEIRYLKKEKFHHGVLAAFWIAAAVMLKTNAYIAVVAMGILLLLQAMVNLGEAQYRKAAEKLFLLILAILLSKGISDGIGKYYAHAAGLEQMPSGTTALAYAAMGMQEGDNTYGWYNGFNANTLKEHDFDKEAVNRVSREAIRESLQYFREHPRYAVKFYLLKYLSQWNDSTCVSMREYELTGRHGTGQPAVLQSVIFGRTGRILQWKMDVEHGLLYMMAVFFAVTYLLKGKNNWAAALLALYILGGMIFHQLWEGSGRYAMRYYIYLLPMAAAGMNTLLTQKKKDR